jgi:hypothetical protein
MDEAGARESLRETVADLQNTFAAINVQFNITFSSGTAEMSSQDNSECANCAYNITSGAVSGAINVFLHVIPGISLRPLAISDRRTARFS